MLELPAGPAEVVEASQVSEYQQLVYELITFKTCTCRSKVLGVGGSKSRGHLPGRGQLAPEREGKVSTALQQFVQEHFVLKKSTLYVYLLEDHRARLNTFLVNLTVLISMKAAATAFM